MPERCRAPGRLRTEYIRARFAPARACDTKREPRWPRARTAMRDPVQSTSAAREMCAAAPCAMVRAFQQHALLLPETPRRRSYSRVWSEARERRHASSHTDDRVLYAAAVS